MNNDVIKYQELLNKYSESKAWQYIPWKDVEAAIGKSDTKPLSLVAFESKNGVGVDPYYGLPYKKYLYYVNMKHPRNDFELSVNKIFSPVALFSNSELNSNIDPSRCLKSMSFSRNTTIAEAVPAYPVESATLSLTFNATLTSMEPDSIVNIGMGKEFGGDFSYKVQAAYDHVFSNFKMAISEPSANGFPVEMGVKNEILIDANKTGIFASKISISDDNSYTGMAQAVESRGTIHRYKATSSNEYAGSCYFSFGGVKWKIDFSIGYEMNAILVIGRNNNNNNSFEFVTLDLRAPVRNVASDYGRVNAELRDNWWSNYGRDVAIGGAILAGVVLIVAGGSLEGFSLGFATPVAAGLVVMGITLLNSN